jgi:hypothetical protein
MHKTTLSRILPPSARENILDCGPECDENSIHAFYIGVITPVGGDPESGECAQRIIDAATDHVDDCRVVDDSRVDRLTV